jgi:hypothetical protein
VAIRLIVSSTCEAAPLPAWMRTRFESGCPILSSVARNGERSAVPGGVMVCDRCPHRDEPVVAPSRGVVRVDCRESGRIGTVYGEGVLAGRFGLHAAIGDEPPPLGLTNPLAAVKPVRSPTCDRKMATARGRDWDRCNHDATVYALNHSATQSSSHRACCRTLTPFEF